MGTDVELNLFQPPIPLIDAKEVRQMILNMARNGLEAMSPDGALTIGTLSEDNEIVLFIKDQGNGLDPNLIAKIGTPFITTKDKGTGNWLVLRLLIKRKIGANNHEGQQKELL
jgi:C4-dicarboxylate-specific signal transduction histidine kinase